MRTGPTTRGRFIAVEGIDGAGKTTLAQIAARILAADGVTFCARKQVCEAPKVVHDAMADLAALLWKRGDCRDDNLLPPGFWLHLQAAWYAAYSHCLLAPQLAAGTTVLVDGWHYKFAAKLRMLGFSQTTLDAAFAQALAPDAVILLDIDPAQAWQRQRNFNQSELGLHQGYRALGRESFLSYQGEVLAGMREFAARYGWTILKLDATAAPAINAERLAACVRRINGAAPAASAAVSQY
jgi:thymidylate kinase